MDRYRVSKEEGWPHLCTCVFNNWVPIFICGEAFLQIAVRCLSYCREKKGLKLHAYVLMPDHLHLILHHPDPSALMREFKTWTSRQITEELKRSGRSEVLSLLKVDAAHATDNWQFNVWKGGFHPKSIMSDAMMLQKLEYVHLNPVRKGFVRSPEDWRYSSAAAYAGRKDVVMPVDLLPPLII